MSQGHRFNPEKAERLLDPKRQDWVPTEKVLSLLEPNRGEFTADLGAGNGYFTLPIAAETKQTVYAVDIEPKMLEALRLRAEEQEIDHIDYVKAELSRIPLPDASVDKIFSAFVMHEVPDLEATIHEMTRLIKAGGLFLILDWEAIEMEDGPPLHVRIPSDKLASTFADHGFDVEKTMLSEAVYALKMKKTNNK